MTGLEELKLANNSLTALRADMFLGLSGLLTLDLSGNQISSLPDNCFQALVKTQIINLDSNNIPSLFAQSLSGLESLKSLSIAHNQLTDSSMGYIANIVPLEKLNLENNRIRSLPQGAFSMLRNLADLNLRSNGLGKIDDVMAASIENVTILDVGMNELTDDFFTILPSLTRLQQLRIDSNAFNSIPTDAFYLPNITRNPITSLNVSNNNLNSDSLYSLLSSSMLIELYADDNALTSLPEDVFEALNATLTVLSLKNNQLDNAALTSLKTLYMLSELHLDGNLLTSLPASVFGQMTSMRKLTLSANRLSTINRHMLYGLGDSLEVLDLSDNDIALISDDAFNAIWYVRELYLGSNQLSSLMLSKSMRWLRVLDLRQNMMTSFPAGVHRFRTIEYLDLAHNDMTTLPQLTISSSSFVKLIDFSNNRLTSVDSLMLMDAIRQLYFDNNMLESLSDEIFEAITEVHTLSLAGNQFETIPRAVQLSSSAIRELYLNDNRINLIPDWSSGSSIELLDLSQNAIVAIPAAALHGLGDAVRSINLQHNQLETLNYSAISELTNLESLWLYGNRWLCDCNIAWLHSIYESINIGFAQCSSPDEVVGTHVLLVNVSNCAGFEQVVLPDPASLPLEPTSSTSTTTISTTTTTTSTTTTAMPTVITTAPTTTTTMSTTTTTAPTTPTPNP